MRVSLESVLRSQGYEVRLAESAEAGLALLRSEEFFMVITDARLGGMSGFEFLKEVKQKHPQLPVLMITAYATPKLAVEAIKNGAMDYLGKPFEPDELLHAVARCGECHELLIEIAALKRRAGEAYTLDHLIGDSQKIRDVAEAPIGRPAESLACARRRWGSAAPIGSILPARPGRSASWRADSCSSA